ncbi:Ig-like domain-containing protein [Balneola sp. MJW-20]|uniref:Ig-like domain-containing protein n=1 Tax=Gracilimonas aurantiaca TaxID=3234185 RepID=UPI003908E2B9
MKKKYLLYHIIVLTGIMVLSSCANPMPPTGGPRDTQAPDITNTEPETGTVNFDGRRFDIEFSEYINRSSVASAISVEPDLGFDFSLKWKRTRLSITFEDELPDSTTLIITLGPQISDTRGNKLGKPYSMAISTGDRIDSGALTGRILSARDGSSLSERTVFLYREPFNLEERANYKAQTDTSGRYSFSYLKEGNYRALLVDDRNRNNTWDPQNESAYPFDKEMVQIEEEITDTLNTIYVAQRDTLSPELQGVGLLSKRRMRLRFSEGIRVLPDNEISISDSSGNLWSKAYLLYPSPEDPFVLFAQTEKELIESMSFSIYLRGFEDESGNTLKENKLEFNGSAQQDTTFQRLIGINSREIDLRDSLVITFAAPVTQPEIIDSTVIIEGDVAFKDWPGLDTLRNKLIISPQGEWIRDIDYQFQVWDPATRKRNPFTPEIWDSTDYGAIELILSGADSTSVYDVILEDEGGQILREESFSRTLLLSGLAPLKYRLIVFRDDNDNQEWDSGTVVPYSPPEKYYVQFPVTIENGFTSTIRLSFN